jgi:hypothetical protein
MVKDLFERIQNNKGPLGKWASQIKIKKLNKKLKRYEN